MKPAGGAGEGLGGSGGRGGGGSGACGPAGGVLKACSFGFGCGRGGNRHLDFTVNRAAELVAELVAELEVAGVAERAAELEVAELEVAELEVADAAAGATSTSTVARGSGSAVSYGKTGSATSMTTAQFDADLKPASTPSSPDLGGRVWPLLSRKAAK